MKSTQTQLYTLLYIGILFFSCKPNSVDLSNPSNISLKNLPHQPTPFTLTIPEFFDPMSIPTNNPFTDKGIALGRFLFYDSILSENDDFSCANCHQQIKAFSDNLAISVGANNQIGKRSVASLVNIGYAQPAYFLDGRADNLEMAVENHIQEKEILDGNWEGIILKIQESSFYREKFRAAFLIENTSEINSILVSKAISQFLRTLVSANSNYDQVISSNSNGLALTELELDGYFLFFREQNFTLHPGCSHCHDSPYYAGDDFSNNGIDSIFQDNGRGTVTGLSSDNGKFRAPVLRNIEFTAPYMHDGRFETLTEVIEHYQSGGHFSESLHEDITGFELSDYEKEALIAFLKSLSDIDFIENSNFSSPF